MNHLLHESSVQIILIVLFYPCYDTLMRLTPTVLRLPLTVRALLRARSGAPTVQYSYEYSYG